MTVLRSGAASDVGRVRSVNQDLALESSDLYAVADGMGGHAGGEVAARLAVDALRAAFARQPSVEGLRDAVEEANNVVWSQSVVDADLRGMGTTLTAAAVVPTSDGGDVVVLANVGDSRAYVYSGGRIAQITKDHSLAEEKVRQGEMTEAEAAVHPHRHILTRALGVAEAVTVDLWELQLRTADRLLLCSDGLTNEVGINELGEVLGSVGDPCEAARVLVKTANDHGGSDNITVLVIDVLFGEGGGDGSTTVVTPVALAGTGPSVVLAAGATAVADPDAPYYGAGPDEGGDPDATAMAMAVGASALVGSPLVGGGGPAGSTDLTGVVPGVADDDLVVGSDSGRPGSTGVVDLPPPAPSEPEMRRETRRERRRRLGIPRRITLRVLLFALLVLAVIAGGFYFVRWYATDNWYVTVRGDQLVIYQGRPGGLLWYRPKLVAHTGVTTAQVLPVHLAALHADVEESSLTDARGYVRTLAEEYQAQQQLASGGANGAAGTGPSGTIPVLTPPPTTTAPTTAPPGATPRPGPGATPTTTPGTTTTVPPPATTAPAT